MNLNNPFFAVYQDDGATGPGGQDNSTMPQNTLLIFDDEETMRAKIREVEEITNRKNPRITGVYRLQEPGDLPGGYWPVKVFEKPGDTVKIVHVSGPCWNGDCDCQQYDGLHIGEDDPMPPFHKGCTCGVAVLERDEPK